MKKQSEKILQNLMTYYVDSTLVPVDSPLSQINTGKELTLAYGETYDVYGLTLDSLKYYFFLSVLASLLKSEGFTVNASVIVGDVASIRNKNVDEAAVLQKTQENLLLLSKVLAVYALPITFVQMSHTFETQEFKKMLDTVQGYYEKDPEIQKLAESTIMRNRLKQESEAGFLYSLEEVALIADCDIKVGAKREINYDKMANLVKEHLKKGLLQGVYLKPTYPLGVQFDYFLQHPEIEEYGLTPYKAGSNKMQTNRVILNKTSISDLSKLVATSFCHEDASLPNAVRELYLISVLAKAVYTKDLSVLSSDELFKAPSSSAVVDAVAAYIYKPLGLEQI